MEDDHYPGPRPSEGTIPGTGETPLLTHEIDYVYPADDPAYQEEDGDPANSYSPRRVFDVLKELLHPQSNMDTDTAAIMLGDLFPRPTAGALGTLLEYFGLDLAMMAEQTPHNHVSQICLMRLVQSLCKCNQFMEVFGAGQRDVTSVWDTDTILMENLCPWRVRLWESGGGDFFRYNDAMVNYSAFLGRLTACGFGEGWTRVPIIWISRLLEPPLDPQNDNQKWLIRSGAVFMLYGGQELFNTVALEPQYDGSIADANVHGPLRGGDYVGQGPNFGVVRWRWWRQRLTLAANSDFDEETKTLARKAARLMRALEGTIC